MTFHGVMLECGLYVGFCVGVKNKWKKKSVMRVNS